MCVCYQKIMLLWIYLLKNCPFLLSFTSVLGRQDLDEIAYINTTPANLQASVVTGSGANVQDAIAKYVHRHQPEQL